MPTLQELTNQLTQTKAAIADFQEPPAPKFGDDRFTAALAAFDAINTLMQLPFNATEDPTAVFNAIFELVLAELNLLEALASADKSAAFLSTNLMPRLDTMTKHLSIIKPSSDNDLRRMQRLQKYCNNLPIRLTRKAIQNTYKSIDAISTELFAIKERTQTIDEPLYHAFLNLISTELDLLEHLNLEDPDSETSLATRLNIQERSSRLLPISTLLRMLKEQELLVDDPNLKSLQQRFEILQNPDAVQTQRTSKELKYAETLTGPLYDQLRDNLATIKNIEQYTAPNRAIKDYLNETNLKIIANLLGVTLTPNNIDIMHLLEQFHAKSHNATPFQRELYAAVVALIENPDQAQVYIEKLTELSTSDNQRINRIATRTATADAIDVEYVDNATEKYEKRIFVVNALLDNAKAVSAAAADSTKKKNITTTAATLKEINTTGTVTFWNNPIKFFQQAVMRIKLYFTKPIIVAVDASANVSTTISTQASPLETSANYPEIYEKVDLNRAIREEYFSRAESALAIANRANINFATLTTAIAALNKVINVLNNVNADLISLQEKYGSDQNVHAYCQAEINKNPETDQKCGELANTLLTLKEKAFALEIQKAQASIEEKINLLQANRYDEKIREDIVSYVKDLDQRLSRQIPADSSSETSDAKTKIIFETLGKAIALLNKIKFTTAETLGETIKNKIFEATVTRLQTQLQILERNVEALNQIPIDLNQLGKLQTEYINLYQSIQDIDAKHYHLSNTNYQNEIESLYRRIDNVAENLTLMMAKQIKLSGVATGAATIAPSSITVSPITPIATATTTPPTPPTATPPITTTPPKLE